jgi:hypothetical protein
MIQRILFKGEPFLLVGEHAGSEAPEGAISTEPQYRNGLGSYAHLFPDGRVLRHRKQIGTREDVEWLGAWDGTVTVDEAIDALGNLLTDPSWSFNRP